MSLYNLSNISILSSNSPNITSSASPGRFIGGGYTSTLTYLYGNLGENISPYLTGCTYTVFPTLSSISIFNFTLGFKNSEPNSLNAERPCTKVSGISCTLKTVLSLSSRNTCTSLRFSLKAH